MSDAVLAAAAAAAALVRDAELLRVGRELVTVREYRPAAQALEQSLVLKVRQLLARDGRLVSPRPRVVGSTH